MPDKTTHHDRLERLMHQLAESVLGLSDDAIVAETLDAHSDPNREAAHARQILRQASNAADPTTEAPRLPARLEGRGR
jgi:hypothetical protein